MQLIGRYEIERELGRGGMAVVYLGRDPFMKRYVAVKVLPHQFTTAPELRTRFQREAEVIASLEHPAIVPVYDFGEYEGQPFIVMRYMPGGSLAERLRQGALSLAQTATILQRLGSALDRAHSHGIIHRDLKPGNVLFDQYGEAYLSDFGIARLSEASVALTGSGVIGTPAYMSPEQIYGDRPLDGRSDVYALGVILFEMLTGQLPYRADTPAKIMMKHVLDPVPRLLEIKPELPNVCERLIEQAMAKEPDDRFATGAALAQAVSGVAGAKAGELAAAPPKQPAQPAAAEVKEKESPPAGNKPPKANSASYTATEVAPPPDAGPPAAARPVAQPPRRPAWLFLAGGFALLGLLAGACLVTWVIAANLRSSGPFVDSTPAMLAVPPTTVTVAATGADSNIRSTAAAPAIPLNNNDDTATDADTFSGWVEQARLGLGDVQTMALSPDGQLLALAGSLGIWLYDTTTFESAHFLEGHSGRVSSLDWSSDGRYLASGSFDQTVRIWDVVQATDLSSFTGHRALVYDVAWSPDGRFLVSADWSGVVRIWQADNGREVQRLEEHDGTVFAVAASPDGSLFATAGEDGAVRLYDWTGQKQHDLAGFADQMTVAEWSPDGTLLAVAGKDGNLNLWDSQSHRLVSWFAHDYGVEIAKWSPDGRYLATTGADGYVHLWDVNGQERVRTWDEYGNPRAITWLADSKTLLFAFHHQIHFWDSQSGQELAAFHQQTYPINTLQWMPDGSAVVSASEEGSTWYWPLDQADEPAFVEGYLVALSPDGTIGATAGDLVVNIWNLTAGEIMHVLEQPNYNSALVWSPQGTYLAATDWEGLLQIWNPTEGRLLQAIESASTLRVVAWSPDETKLATSGSYTLQVWDVTTGASLAELSAHDGDIFGLAWSPDGTLLASAGVDGAVRLWRLEASGLELVHEGASRDNALRGLSWSPDGRYLAAASWGGQIYLFDAQTLRIEAELGFHTGPVLAVAWSPDGRYLASGGADGTVRIWGAPTTSEP
jgi:WD40 repeat protein/predicted Ser/Thr protein kinase